MNGRILNTYINKLTTLNKYSENDLLSIRYSALVLMGEVEKLLIMVMFFILNGHLLEFSLALAAIIPIRSLAGGLHLNSFFSCLLFSTIYYYFIVEILANIILAPWLSIALLLTATIINAIFAPVQSAYRPKLNKEKRRKSKILTTYMHLVCFLALLLMIKVNSPYTSLIAWAIFTQSILLIPGRFYNVKKS